MEACYPYDDYSTAAGAAAPTRRLLATSRLSFYLSYLRVVLRSSSLARRGLYTSEEWIRASAAVRRVYESRGGLLNVEGLGHIRALGGPAVFVGNHMSTAETQLLPALIEPFAHFTFVVKQRLMEGPVFGPVMRAVDAIGVGQMDARRDLETVLTEGCRRLESGTSVFIFPEGTRSAVFSPARFNSLGVKLARRAGVPIVPVALKTDFWGNGRLIRPFGPIDCSREAKFKFGAPVRVEGSGKDAHAEVLSFILRHLAEWNMPCLESAQRPGPNLAQVSAGSDLEAAG